MGVLSASMLTLREGRRFVSRRLTPGELRIVTSAMATWESCPDAAGAAAMREALRSGRLLAMHSLSFARVEERSTFGYTDERGRILLNPNLCFGNQRLSGKSDHGDLVATMCTLYHESRHMLYGATEASAYEDEWVFARRNQAWAAASQPELARELSVWGEEMPCRIQLYVGDTMVAKIQGRVEQRYAHLSTDGAPSAPSEELGALWLRLPLADL